MTTIPQKTSILKEFMQLLVKQRSAFGQERVYLRVVALALAELVAFGRHRVTDLLRVLHVDGEDWSAWYRLLQRPQRFAEAEVAKGLFAETLAHVSAEAEYVVGVDVTHVPRDSQKMEGSGWAKCPRNPVWRVGIHRAQRFLNGSWLSPMVNGFSRAVPLRFMPTFPEKAVRQVHAAVKEQQAGLEFVRWVRQNLDAAGRELQVLLCLGDGSYDKPDFWRGLPAQTVALVRTAKNRALCHLPGPYPGKGRRRTYGEDAPAPHEYLNHRDGWRSLNLSVRGHTRRIVYRVEGPFLRRGMAEVPLFLLVVRGQAWAQGNKRKRRQPCFYLVNALCLDGQWHLPLPTATLLAWAWQRWELEVVHREVKSLFGLGHKQCFHPLAAVTAVQWSAWVYALLILAGLRTYGLGVPFPRHAAWQRHPRRWTFSSLLDDCRLELFSSNDFFALFSPSMHNWLEIEPVLRSLCARFADRASP